MSGDFSWLGDFLSSLWGWAFVILLLGGSIFIHELGHFLAARWRGLKVECFSIGFGPKIFGWVGKDGVDYRVSWIPLGGYVRIPQLLDMSGVEGESATDVRDLPPVSYLDKMITVSAGVVFNLLFALVLAFMIWPLGLESPASSQTRVVGYVYHTMGELREGKLKRELALLRGPDAPKPDNTPAPAEGKIQLGDEITAVDGAPVDNFEDIAQAVAFSTGRDAQGHPQVTLTLKRNGVEQQVLLTPALIPTNERSGDAVRELGLQPADDLVVADSMLNSPALRFHDGDKVMTINGQKAYSTRQMNELIDANPGRPLTFTVERDGQSLDLSIQPVPLARTTPLATITVPADKNAASVDILPVYAENETGSHASPTTPAQSLMVWNVDHQGGALAGLHMGDLVRKVNGQLVQSIQQLVDALKATPAGQPAVISYDRKDTHDSATLALPAGFGATVVPPGTTALLGASFGKTITRHPTPPELFGQAFGQIFGTLRSLLNPHSDIGLSQLSGPIGISRIIYESALADIRWALWFVLIINVNLAIINLLPIPLLDGGHILFYTIERLRRRALPMNVIATAQAVCLVLLMGLALFVFVNDSRRWAGDNDDEARFLRNNFYLLGGNDLKFPAPSSASGKQ